MKVIPVSESTFDALKVIKLQLSRQIDLTEDGVSYSAMVSMFCWLFHKLSSESRLPPHEELEAFLKKFPKRGRPRTHQANYHRYWSHKNPLTVHDRKTAEKINGRLPQDTSFRARNKDGSEQPPVATRPAAEGQPTSGPEFHEPSVQGGGQGDPGVAGADGPTVPAVSRDDQPGPTRPLG